MTKHFSRRDILRLSVNAGLALTPLGLAACGGGGGGGGDGGGDDGGTPTPTGYKALVVVQLLGGNDAYNMIVPMTDAKFASYAASRGDLALARGPLHQLDGQANDGAVYGAHPRCAALAQLFNAGRAALVTNVGSLAAPTTRADFEANRNLPARLFSHNDQRDQWASLLADGTGTDGWCGRIADTLPSANPGALLPMNLSIAGANLAQSGRISSALTVDKRGPSQLSLGPLSRLRATYDALQALPRTQVLETEFVAVNRRALQMHGALESALSATPAPATAFPDNDFALQLQLVAHLLKARNTLGMRRQIFYVELGNFDTHTGQLDRHDLLLARLSSGLAAFQQAVDELGLANSVTTFTTSDFGRSLTVNGSGTDHGWSGHHWVIGGAVRGGAWYGDMPSLEVGGADDARTGRFIPSTSIEEYVAGIAAWFGVGSGDLGYVLPHLNRFATRGLPLFG